jgi:ABC-type multidrug transport system fused ATPase/permease subunit
MQSVYGYGVREVSRKPFATTVFLTFSCLQSVGHAGLALAGAACAQEMLGSSPRIPAFASGWVGKDIVGLALLGFVAACVKAAGGVGSTYCQSRLSGAVSDALRLAVLKRRAHEVAHPRQDDQGAEVGASTTFVAVDDLTMGIREVERGLVASLSGVKAVLQLVPLVLLALWAGTRLVVVAGLVMLPFTLALSRMKRWVKALQKRTLDESASLLEATDEAIRHAELWSSYDANARVEQRVASAGRAITRAASKAFAFAAGVSGATEALGALALLLVVLGARQGVFGRLDGGRLLAFAVAFFMAYKPVRELAEARVAWTRAGVAAERLGLHDARNARSRLESSEQVCERLRLTTLEVLELRDVQLSRGKLGAINARIDPGTIVVIQGATGIGKTTLLRTLLGFARLRAGEIRHGDTPLHPALLAWVPQDAPVVRGTLTENVTLGGGANVAAILEEIGALDLYERLGDAQLGVGGRALSGGEQKQVAIARALATQRPVLLLDEPTSGLDDRAEAAVLSAIARLRGKRTVLLVTHRPEPVVIADAIVFLRSEEARAPGRAVR